jgi:hypothetical protein
MPVLRAHTQACLFYVPIRRRACSTCPYAGVPVLRAPGPVADPGGRAHEALGQGQAGHRRWGRVATKSHLGSHSVILNYGQHAIKIFLIGLLGDYLIRSPPSPCLLLMEGHEPGPIFLCTFPGWAMHPSDQGCWRNEGSMDHGVDRGRGLGLNESFFLILACSLNSTRYFKFRKNSISQSSFPKIISIARSSSRNIHTPPTPLNNLESVVFGLFLETYGEHLDPKFQERGHTPLPPPPSPPPPSSPPPYSCVPEPVF